MENERVGTLADFTVVVITLSWFWAKLSCSRFEEFDKSEVSELIRLMWGFGKFEVWLVHLGSVAASLVGAWCEKHEEVQNYET